jgi:hypothetical protein
MSKLTSEESLRNNRINTQSQNISPEALNSKEESSNFTVKEPDLSKCVASLLSRPCATREVRG